MTELLDTVASWPSLLLVVAIFGFAPGFCLRLMVFLYPRNDPRRAGLVAELYVVPRLHRPLWVAEQLEVALFEGLIHRASATIRRLTGWRQARLDRRPRQLQLEALYDQALLAFWTEQWDQAVLLLKQLLVHRPQRDWKVAVRLAQARQQQLAIRYTQACAAVENLDWDEAVKMFAMVAEVDPGYQDVGQRLDNARRRQQIAGWQADIRRLYRAGQWVTVVKLGERLHLLDPAAADPDGLVSSARALLACRIPASLFSRLRARYGRNI